MDEPVQQTRDGVRIVRTTQVPQHPQVVAVRDTLGAVHPARARVTGAVLGVRPRTRRQHDRVESSTVRRRHLERHGRTGVVAPARWPGRRPRRRAAPTPPVRSPRWSAGRAATHSHRSPPCPSRSLGSCSPATESALGTRPTSAGSGAAAVSPVPAPARRSAAGRTRCPRTRTARPSVRRHHRVSTPITSTLAAPPGLPTGSARVGRISRKNRLASSLNSGSALRSTVIASTGHASSHAPQSMHSFGLM